MKIDTNLLIDVSHEDIVNGTFTIPQGVTQIGKKAFQGCTGLSAITIPEGVTKIGNSAFAGCTSLSAITISEGVTKIGDNAFKGCTSLSAITIPEGVTGINWAAFEGCTSLSAITIPEGVTEIGLVAFSGCTSLTTITIPEGVTAIGAGAFQGCTRLSAITIPEGVTTIGLVAFSGCTSLSAITIPEGVKTICEGAFKGCTSLTTITIPQGVTKIYDWAFSGCTRLSTIIVCADTQEEFERIKALLPGELQSKAVHGIEQQFNWIIKPLTDYLSKATAGQETGNNEAKSLDIINDCIEDAQKYLKTIESFAKNDHQKLKKAFDSLVVRLHLKQGHRESALAHFQDNPEVDESALLDVASICFTLGDGDINPLEKHKAMISLFKEHHQNKDIHKLLTQSVLYLLNQKPPAPAAPLLVAETAIAKCVSLSSITKGIDQVINGMLLKSDMKTKLIEIKNHLHLLTHQEMLALFQIPAVKAAFESNPEIGSANVLPFESFYYSQPKPYKIPTDGERFLGNTVALIGIEKRAEQYQSSAEKDKECISDLIDALKPEASYLKKAKPINKRITKAIKGLEDINTQSLKGTVEKNNLQIEALKALSVLIMNHSTTPFDQGTFQKWCDTHKSAIADSTSNSVVFFKAQKLPSIQELIAEVGCLAGLDVGELVSTPPPSHSSINS